MEVREDFGSGYNRSNPKIFNHFIKQIKLANIYIAINKLYKIYISINLLLKFYPHIPQKYHILEIIYAFTSKI